MTGCTTIAIILGSLLGAELPADFALDDPPGPHRGPTDASAPAGFRAGEPLVATSYFYWYDAPSKAHVLDHDGTDALTDHPPTLEGFSYNNVAWHAEQLDDMIAAGIDVALPVYWGIPLPGTNWNHTGLDKLVAARRQLIEAGKKPPAIGMFYDTSTLRRHRSGYHVDLTTAPGRLWFYGTIRNFFSQVSPDDRATIDGRPLVFLYASAFAADVDDRLFPAVRKMFRKDFGTDLYLVKMRGWPGEADSEYQWGGALGAKILDTAGIGPGYDHSAVPNRDPLVRSRDEGRFYTFGWQRLLAMDPKTRPWLVHVETWNEFHEGTEICETREYGRKYIEMTRQFADQFHARRRLDPSEIAGRREVISATPEKSEGLSVMPQPSGDGPVVERTVGGRKAWCTTRNQHSPDSRYLYFEVEDYFLYEGDEPVEVTIGYFDAGGPGFRLEYDSADPELTGLSQAFRPGHTQPIGDSRAWKEVTFVIPHAHFASRANSADFRLATGSEDLIISHVRMRRPKP